MFGVLLILLSAAYTRACVPHCYCDIGTSIEKCSPNFEPTNLQGCPDFQISIIPCDSSTTTTPPFQPPPMQPPLSPPFQPPPFQPPPLQPPPSLPANRPLSVHRRVHHQSQSYHKVEVVHTYDATTASSSSSTIQQQSSYEASEESIVEINRERAIAKLLELVYDYKIGISIVAVVLIIILLLLVICRHTLANEARLVLRTLLRFLITLFRGRFFRQNRREVVRNLLADAAELRRRLAQAEIQRLANRAGLLLLNPPADPNASIRDLLDLNVGDGNPNPALPAGQAQDPTQHVAQNQPNAVLPNQNLPPANPNAVLPNQHPALDAILPDPDLGAEHRAEHPEVPNAADPVDLLAHLSPTVQVHQPPPVPTKPNRRQSYIDLADVPVFRSQTLETQMALGRKDSLKKDRHNCKHKSEATIAEKACDLTKVSSFGRPLVPKVCTLCNP